MPDYTRMNKADLIERIAALEARPEPVVYSAPAPVPEAETLATCIRAFDRLLDGSRRGTSSGFQPFGYAEPRGRIHTAEGRILALLAEKYGVDLVEVKTVPCDRAHVDTIDPGQFQAAIQGVLHNASSGYGNGIN